MAEQRWRRATAANPRDFLDLFHHRLQRLMLPIWRKYRYGARFRGGDRPVFQSSCSP
jgi:type VI secretion system protein ImpH